MNLLLFPSWDDILNWVTGFVLDILCFIPKIMYFLLTCLLSIIDLFQITFRKLAGLDPIIISGELTTGDSVYKIIMDALFSGTYPAIGTIFWSLIVLGVFMLIVTALIATIRIEYNPDKDKGNSKSGIIRNFLKGLFSLVIIPVASIFGMFLTNSLVQVIDTITSNNSYHNAQLSQYFEQWGTEDVEPEFRDSYNNSYMAYSIFGISIPTTAEPFSGTVFKASAYTCSRFRKHGAPYLAQVIASGTDLGVFGNGRVTESGDAADIIDTAFAVNAKLKNNVGRTLYDLENKEYYSEGFLSFFGSRENVESFSKYNVEMVWYFYDLWTFNFIIGFVGVIAIGKLYATFCMMLFARIFELLSLFIFAPVVVGIMPMDNGGALGRWRLTYVAKFGLVLVMVFGMNMVSPVINVMQEITFFGNPLLDYIVLTVMIVSALSAVNTLINTFSTILFDKASSYESSSKIATEASGNLKQGVAATRGAAGFAMKAGALPVRAGVAGAKYARGKMIELKRKGFDNREKEINKDYDFLEKQAAMSSLNYGAAEKNTQEALFNTMTNEQRREWGEEFLKSEEGKQFLANMNGATDAQKRANALRAIEENNFRGRTAAGVTAESQRDKIFEHMHNKAMFDKTNDSKNYEKGSADYYAALEDYRNKTKEQRAEMHVGGEAIDANHRRVQNLRKTELDDNEKKRKEYEDKIAWETKKRKPWKTIYKGGARVAGEFSSGAQKMFKPFAGSLQSLMNLIPGLGLFSSDKKDK